MLDLQQNIEIWKSMEGIDQSIFVELHKKSLKAPSENLNKKLETHVFLVYNWLCHRIPIWDYNILYIT